MDKQRSIIRQNSLAHALNCVLARYGDDKKKDASDLAALAVTVAPIFEAYSAGDTIREKVEAGIAAADAATTADDTPF